MNIQDQKDETRKIWARIVATAWMDEEYKKRLLKDPGSVLQEENVPVPEGLTIKVIEDAPGCRTLVLPPPPADLGTVGTVEERLAATDTGGGSTGMCCC